MQDSNWVKRRSHTPLMISAFNGHTHVLQLLLKANVDINQGDKKEIRWNGPFYDDKHSYFGEHIPTCSLPRMKLLR